ncbi:MAG: hypothetical protein HY889_08880 [Deltaproteobacteria bacterium]|nr:hypothetical protein [Deltaproteobacteria bacterium]
MAITLTPRYSAEIKKGSNTPNVIVEVAFDSGVKRFGYHGKNSLPVTHYRADGSFKADGPVYAVGSDELPEVSPVLKSVSSMQNKLDTKSGYSTRGSLTVVISGRDNFKGLVRDNYLKNRRVTRKDGFISPGFTYMDYAATFTGIITDWSRKGDELTITVSDDLAEASCKIPQESPSGTQYLDYRNTHPADVMADILVNRIGIQASYVDTAKFASERDLWSSGWRFDRVITEPKEANLYLNELQIETNSYIIHDGEKISYKVFAPPVPADQVEEWTDATDILKGSVSQKSGYRDGFYNRIVVYFDYDESGNDRTDNFESAVIALDASSQAPSFWNEASTKTIKSKWIRTRTYAKTTNIGGVKVYHVSRANGTGAGTLAYNRLSNTLQWTSPGGTIGEAVILSKDGKYQVMSLDKTRYIRVIVNTANLPPAGATDTVTVTPLDGDAMAANLATKLLSRYRDPASSVSLEIDINNAVFNSRFIKPTDLKDITTDDACEKGYGSWTKERVMITSVRPDFASGKVTIEAVETKMYRVYGFIPAALFPDYGPSSQTQRLYGYIGNASNRVNAGTKDGYYIW